MPISEDEYEAHRQQQHGLSRAEQRRSNKPIMEKRRRARINHCLNELKTLILDAMKKDPARHSKLEKADILEMTVRHLQSVQRQQLAVAVATDPGVLSKFRTGFSECAGEVGRYLGRLSSVEPAVRQRLSGHLSQCIASLQQLDPNNNPGLVGVGVTPATTAAAGLALVPHRLPTGELALVLPHGLLPITAAAGAVGVPQQVQHSAASSTSASTAATTTTTSTTADVTNSTTVTTAVSSTPSSAMDRSHPSAFTAVNPRQAVQAPPSPLPSPTSTISDDDSLITEPYPPPPSPPPLVSMVRGADHRAQETWLKVPAFRLFPLGGTEGAPPSVAGEDKPHQQPHVTSSTCDNGSGSLSVSTSSSLHHQSTPVGVSAVAELKVEFKTVPVISTVTFPSSKPDIAPSVPTDQPLSVITNLEDKGTSVSATSPAVKAAPLHYGAKDPLDFSLRRDEYLQFPPSSLSQPPLVGSKRPFPTTEPSENTVSSLLTLPPPSKMPHLSFRIELPNDTDQISSSSQQAPTSQESPLDGTSASTTENASSSSSSKDMWRPW
ncbi:protein deadpan-like [Schistocerca cancellata]|uniref:protein deadpan-like n=1 Tax=Schistocerca cancellata TaxID=274614 RepID=UPI0021181DB1|nr:protein deadpan-like [Schistocerca cancellata]